MSVYLHVIYGCFHYASQFSSGDGCLTGHKAKHVYYLAFYGQSYRLCSNFCETLIIGSALSSFDYKSNDQIRAF